MKRLISSLLLSLLLALSLHAAPATAPSSDAPMEYKMITNFKQPFNDDLQYHLSKGWKPVGGVSVTVWNNDLYYAQLLGRAKQAGQ